MAYFGSIVFDLVGWRRNAAPDLGAERKSLGNSIRTHTNHGTLGPWKSIYPATGNNNYDIGACFHEVQALGQASPSIIQKEDPRVAEVLGRASKGHKNYDAGAC